MDHTSAALPHGGEWDEAGSAPPQRAVLLEMLSERLLAGFPPQVWRDVFLGAASQAIRFSHEPVSFLCATGLAGEWSDAEITGIAQGHAGCVESFGPPLAVGFTDAGRALEFALLLQGTCAARLQIALTTLECITAHAVVDGLPRRLVLGDALERAAAALRAAAPGSIHISPAAYPLVARTLERQAWPAVVSTEVEDGAVTGAAITLAPGKREALSTFAGLGLT